MADEGSSKQRSVKIKSSDVPDDMLKKIVANFIESLDKFQIEKVGLYFSKP